MFEARNVADVRLEWVADMRSNYRSMTTDKSADFTADAVWPVVPAGVSELADGF